MLKIFFSRGRPTPTALTCDTFENIFLHSPRPFVLLLFLIGALKLLPTYTSGSNIRYWTYFVFICTADLDLERLPAFFKTEALYPISTKTLNQLLSDFCNDLKRLYAVDLNCTPAIAGLPGLV